MKQIKGIPGSQGKVTGIARVLKSLSQADKFKAGDILVTQATSPAWTPFIFSAKAVVTDLGGTLSHAAIVAREYGIPAVVGTKVATKTIKDGQKIEVDGTKGIVRIP
jgi:phosphoenolpyruvate synthase/pyruvate phosphate dikinase